MFVCQELLPMLKCYPDVNLHNGIQKLQSILCLQKYQLHKSEFIF